MLKYWSLEPYEKSQQQETYDRDVLGPYCKQGSSCMKLLLDNQIAKEVDPTMLGSMTNLKAIMVYSMRNFVKYEN